MKGRQPAPAPSAPGVASPDSSADFLVVMGIAGTGKTEIGQRLAEALGASFVEADTFS